MALTSNLEELEESEERIFCYLGNKLKENIEINEKWCECVMLIVVFLNPSCLFRSKHIMMMGTEILSFRFSPAYLVQHQFLANVLYNLALMVIQICSVLQIKYSMCNRFQTHKRFKRFEVYKSDVLVLLFWKQNKWLSANHIISPPERENNLIGSSILSELSHDWLPESGCQPASQTAPKQVI